ncbi:hypothetical protein DFH09DRAFT_1309885 [Mycena vulgaris]|nr:hypothetical protein DFH09DRAFT_1309885 [Mycena vulgaris]
MPPRPTITQLRFINIVACLGGAVNTLEVISKSLETPFLQVMSSTIRSLLTAVQASSYNNTTHLGLTQLLQSVKKNKDDCTRMLEQVYELINAIIRLHITSEPAGELAPQILSELARFIETLHKIHTFVEAQQEQSRIKQFFRQGEMNTLLKACNLGLDQALEVFKVQGAHILGDITAMQEYAQKTHQECVILQVLPC